MNNLLLLVLLRSVFVAIFATMNISVYADTIAITNAEVYTVAERGVLSKATVIIDQGMISAVYSKDEVPKTLNVDQIINANGRILTPGLIASGNLLGLVEVSAVSRTRDSADSKADLTFDASLAFNPKSSLIPYARKGGLTSSVVTPYGGEKVLTGQSFVVDLSGRFDSVIAARNGLIASLGSSQKGSRAVKLQTLMNEFEKAKKSLDERQKGEKPSLDQTKAADDKSSKVPSAAEQVLYDVLLAKKPLLAYADRATDILALLKLKSLYNIELVLVGASDAVLVSKAIADANVPVMMNAIDNLPNSFDSLHNALDNIVKLKQAGVKVIISNSGYSHNINQLRFDAGVAVANGLKATDALAAITANVADVFHLNTGRIAAGKSADLVLWSSDPFEISTKVDAMWIKGKPMLLKSRQDFLRERYTKDSAMPRSYTK
jgi:imidazolonepropionase-like amidohydrolase